MIRDHRLETGATRTERSAYLFIAPAALYLVLFSFVPMIVAGYLSVHRWHLLKPADEHVFVGLSNYAALLRDPRFLNAVRNTFVFALLGVPLGVVSSLAAAVLVNRKLPGVAVFRTVFYVPAVVSQVAVAMVWLWVLMPETGLVNTLLGLAGLPDDTDFVRTHAMASLVVVFIWTGLGPRMVIFLAGLQGIPGTLYEAARVDGCTAWQRFRHITLPMLLPTTFFVVVTSTIAAFQIFTPVYIMTRGGPQGATDVLVYHIYNEAWRRLHVGMAGAQTYVLFVIILLVALVQVRFMRRRAEEVARAW